MKRLFSRHRWLSTLLNVLGLTVAFTAFIIIMIQVLYDWRYDRNYPGHEKIFRFEFANDPSNPGAFSTTICRPFIESLKGSIPEVEAIGTYQLYKGSTTVWTKSDDPDQKYNVRTSWLDTGILNIFPFRILEGEISDFARPLNALISKSAADRLFPGESPVGKSMANGYSESGYTIAAVYEDFPENSSVENGILVQLGDDMLNSWSEWSCQCYFKLSDPASKRKVEEAVAEKFLEAFEIAPGSDEEKMVRQGIRLDNLHDAYFAKDISSDPMGKGNRSTTRALFMIGLVIIVIAIINFINLATASIPLTIKDINTRKVLGSSRAALVGRQLADAFVIAIAAFALSILALHLISGSPFTYYISGSMKVGDNLGVIALGGAVALCTAFAAGIFPALYSTSFQPALVLKGSFSLTPKGKMLRNFMVGFQYVASFVLIAMALYIQVQTSYMKHQDMGFKRDLVVECGCGSVIGSKADAVEQKLRQNPHIKDVTFAGNYLVSESKMGWGRYFDGQRVQLDVLPVSSDFIDFFGMQIKEGRDFSPSDDLNPDGTFIMNEKTMENFPFLRLGAKLQGHAAEPAEIVGIVRNFNFKPLQYGIDPIALYVFGSEPWWPLSVVYMKIDGADIPATFQFIRDTMVEFNPAINGEELSLEFLDDTIGSLYQKEKKLNSLIAITAGLSLLISLIGILGIVSFETQFRRKEIALRKVHGASIGTILKMLNRHYIIMTLICFVVSVPVAYIIMKTWVRGFAYQAPVPVWIFIAALAAVLAVTVVTVTLQSRKTASQNPVEALRDE